MLPQRATIKLTRDEDRVLKCVLHGHSSKETSDILELPKNKVNSIRKSIFHKLGAKSVTHLVILAILEYKYYKIINPESSEKHRSNQLTSKEIEVAKLLLQGCLNKEVGDILSIGIRTVEFHRENFKRKTNSHNYPEFVSACLQNGLLKLIPIKSRTGKNDQNDNSILYDSLHIPKNFTKQLEQGWVYIDNRNRFVFEDFPSAPLPSYLRVPPLLIALRISGVPPCLIASMLNEELAIVEHQLRVLHEYAYRTNSISFLCKLHEFGVYKAVIQPREFPRLFALSRLLFIEHMAKSTSKRGKMNILGIDEAGLERHESSVMREFRCDNELAIVAQAVHIGVLNLQPLESD